MEIPSASSRLCFLMDYDSPSADRYILPWARWNEESHCGSRRDSCRSSTSDFETIPAQRSAGKKFLTRIKNDGGNVALSHSQSGLLRCMQKTHFRTASLAARSHNPPQTHHPLA